MVAVTVKDAIMEVGLMRVLVGEVRSQKSNRGCGMA